VVPRGDHGSRHRQYGGEDIGEVHVIGQALPSGWATTRPGSTSGARWGRACARRHTSSSPGADGDGGQQCPVGVQLLSDRRALRGGEERRGPRRDRASLACFQLNLEHDSGPSITRVEVPYEGGATLLAISSSSARGEQWNEIHR